MFQVTMKAELDVLDAMREAAKAAPRAVDVFVNKSVRAHVEKRVDEVLVPPGPPKYPLRWASEKQRRYVMAKLRRENNLPYQRTGDLLAGFKVTWQRGKQGGLLDISNEAMASDGVPLVEYVMGASQQPFHSDTGWPFIYEDFESIGDEATDMLIEGWYSIVEPGKGVRLA